MNYGYYRKEEDLYQDETDRQYLGSLTQTERERIIYERVLEREKLQDRRKIEKSLGKESTTVIPEITSFENKRKAKSKQYLKTTQDDEDLSKVGYHNLIPTTETVPIHVKKPLIEDDLRIEELKSVRLTRNFLRSLLDEPYFDEVVKGMFIRFSYLQRGGKHVYKIGQIFGVMESNRPYKVDNKITNKRLKVRIGKQESSLRICFVSNQTYSNEEFEKWKQQMKGDRKTLPTKYKLEKYRNKLESAKTHQYTENEINEMIKKKKDLGNVKRNYGVQILQLKYKQDREKTLGNKQKVKEIQKKIHKLEKKKDEQRSVLQSGSNLDLLEQINQRNYIKNIEEGDQILKKIRLNNENEDEDDLDAFKKIATVPRQISVVEIDYKKEEEKERKKKEEMEKKKKQKQDLKRKRKLNKKTGLNILEQAHDFELDLELDMDSLFNKK
ncbi:RNA polymerase-associated protein rtf1 [Anaeramoeba flamelloides]|uniref:RNA polymerase-associated protein rtf1 n=1 Tax=Anaeramoeba flamelloides TaxID=1746091 RepID=A0ABQ8Z8N3_9EUKA|nr:RNA polymerase-associated protein rtf1 [Anaeramoeba flamelloides]